MNRLAVITLCTVLLSCMSTVQADDYDRVVITCSNQTEEFVLFEIWDRRPRQRVGSVILAPRSNPGGLPWILPTSTEAKRYKVKAFIWNEVIDQWVGKYRWLYFRKIDGHIGLEFVKTSNGTSYLLREYGPDVEP